MEEQKSDRSFQNYEVYQTIDGKNYVFIRKELWKKMEDNDYYIFYRE